MRWSICGGSWCSGGLGAATICGRMIFFSTFFGSGAFWGSFFFFFSGLGASGERGSAELSIGSSAGSLAFSEMFSKATSMASGGRRRCWIDRAKYCSSERSSMTRAICSAPPPEAMCARIAVEIHRGSGTFCSGDVIRRERIHALHHRQIFGHTRLGDRRDGVDRDAVLLELDRRRAGEAVDAGFGGRIVGLPEISEHPGQAGRVHDAAPRSLADHL